MRWWTCGERASSCRCVTAWGGAYNDGGERPTRRREWVQSLEALITRAIVAAGDPGGGRVRALACLLLELYVGQSMA